MKNPIKFQIKPASKKQHRVRIKHGQTTFISEAYENEGNTLKMVKNMVKEIQAGNFTIEKINLVGKVVNEFT